MSQYIDRINKWFGRQAISIIKYRWLVIALIVVVTAAAVFGMLRINLENSAESWLLEDDPLRLAKEDFEAVYGNNDYVIVLVEAENVFSTEVLAMMRELGDELQKNVPLARDDGITSLTHLEFTTGTVEGIDIGELVPDPVPTDREELAKIKDKAMSKDNFRDRLFSSDGKTAAIILELKPYPKDTGITDMEYFQQIEEKTNEIAGQEKYNDFTLLTGGLPVFQSERLRFIGAHTRQTLGLTLLLIMILLAMLFRSVVGVVAPVLTAFLSAIWVFGPMGWIGIKIQDLVMLIPLLLILVVSVGYSVHILSFFRQRFLATGDRKGSIAHAMEHAAWPILFTALTTALGFLSFLIVPIAPIRWLGYTMALLVMASYPVLILLTPVLLSFGKNREPHPSYVGGEGGKVERILVGLGDWVRTHGTAIVVVFAVVTAVFVFYMTKVQVDTDIVKVAGTDLPFVEKALHIAESIGSLFSFDVTFAFEEEGKAKDPEVLARIEQLADEITAGFEDIKRTNSVNAIIKDLNMILHEGDRNYYKIPEDPGMIAQLLLLYELSGGTSAENWIDYEYRLPRLNVELENFSSQRAEAQLTFVQEKSAELFPDAEIGITGIFAISAKMINYLVSGQIWSILLALTAIAIIMMLAFGSIRLGLIGMIPNFAPVIFVIGAMAMLDTPLNLMTMMVAPMIIGLAVDDTIHYINHFKQEFWRTGSYAKANRETFRTVGKAIFLTSFIICIGFASMLASQALAWRQIGIFTMLAVISALLADYLVTPVLIIWTRAFGPEKAAVESVSEGR